MCRSNSRSPTAPSTLRRPTCALRWARCAMRSPGTTAACTRSRKPARASSPRAPRSPGRVGRCGSDAALIARAAAGTSAAVALAWPRSASVARFASAARPASPSACGASPARCPLVLRTRRWSIALPSPRRPNARPCSPAVPASSVAGGASLRRSAGRRPPPRRRPVTFRRAERHLGTVGTLPPSRSIGMERAMYGTIARMRLRCGAEPHGGAMVDPSIDSREFRNTMGLFATGVTVITTQVSRVRRGMTANAFASVSLHPPLILICVDHSASMHAILEVAAAFAVNIIAADQRAASEAFALHGEREEVMNGMPFRDGALGSPILDGVLGWAECRVEERYAGGDHTIIVGRVESLAVERPDADPLLFFAGGYRGIGGPIAR
ncbi:MAG: flavin reductase [Dehalococcoidia bacterium]|nr:flavin reductase [Dehalococcoidia bacterium]